MIRIGEFSKLAKTTVKTLRFYDDIGLFRPAFVDDNGYRYYDIEQLNVLQKIVALRSLDIPLDSIQRVLSGASVQDVFIERLHELENELLHNQQSILLVKKYMESTSKGDFMNNYQTIEKELPQYNVYYRHGVIATMADITDFILGAGAECGANNPDLQCPYGYCYVTYEAAEYQERNIELEYAEAVDRIGKESQNIKFKTIPATKAICVEHKGAYSMLRDAYAYAINWVKEHGFEITDKIREVYVHGCWDCENENDYLTEIQIPVK